MVAVETQRCADILSAFDIEVASTISGVASGGTFADGRGELIETFDPTTDQVLARVHTPSQVDFDRAVNAAEEAFARSRNVPAPRRGEIVRQLSNVFRERKEDLARLISLENGKILSEARGEVQEVINVCDFAAGQRWTSTRRLILQRGIARQLLDRLTRAHATVRVGDPLDETTLIGPLISARALDGFRTGMAEIVRQGGEIVYGGRVLETSELGGFFVEPTILRSTATMTICAEEIFAPILHVFEVGSLDEAIELNDNVPQGLSSSLFTRDLSAAREWLSTRGSDCGIANVNVGTSGAEIGGAFGGEKATGAGRQAGSDAWKAYMRRQTCTVNYGASLPLALGVHFDLA